MSAPQIIRKKIEAVLAELGLELKDSIAIVPTEEGDDLVKFVIKMDPSSLKTDPEKDMDNKFDNIIDQLKED